MFTCVKVFFARSEWLDREVLRPLSHILPYWETSWDEVEEKYCEEQGSYTALLNSLIGELAAANPPARYHDNEDRLARYVVENLKWPIRKEGNRWAGADYSFILQQGGFVGLNERDLVAAAAGRIHAAITRGQLHYDDMEDSHRRMLAAVLSVILYLRSPPEENRDTRSVDLTP
jgi:hypothetical protein